jgi:hypothetical protein
MNIENATESGWRPATKQDLIDLIDGGEPKAARFRDREELDWKEDRLTGIRLASGRILYCLSTGIYRRFCEIKTQVLRDPKFSDLENGPIECFIYPYRTTENYVAPVKSMLVGMKHQPNSYNEVSMVYYTKSLPDIDNPLASAVHHWWVKVADNSEPIKTKTAVLPTQAETNNDGWRTPTVEDLAYGPIQCEVRDTLDAVWEKRTLESIASLNYYPYRTISSDWRYCRIRK